MPFFSPLLAPLLPGFYFFSVPLSPSYVFHFTWWSSLQTARQYNHAKWFRDRGMDVLSRETLKARLLPDKGHKQILVTVQPDQGCFHPSCSCSWKLWTLSPTLSSLLLPCLLGYRIPLRNQIKMDLLREGIRLILPLWCTPYCNFP